MERACFSEGIRKIVSATEKGSSISWERNWEKYEAGDHIVGNRYIIAGMDINGGRFSNSK